MRTNSESVFLEFFLPFLRTMCVYIQSQNELMMIHTLNVINITKYNN